MSFSDLSLLCRVVTAGIVFMGSIGGLAQGVSFSDATFSGANWSISPISGGAGGQTAMQAATGGNSGGAPDPFWSVTTQSGASVSTFHFNPAYVIDPSSTPIQSINFSIDYSPISAFGQGMGFGFALQQSGVVYSTPGVVSGSANLGSWQTYQLNGITAASFSGVDFSATGAPITFGFQTGNTGGSGINVGFDNYSLNAAVVPEPGTCLLLLSGLASAGLFRRRR